VLGCGSWILVVLWWDMYLYVSLASALAASDSFSRATSSWQSQSEPELDSCPNDVTCQRRGCGKGMLDTPAVHSTLCTSHLQLQPAPGTALSSTLGSPRLITAITCQTTPKMAPPTTVPCQVCPCLPVQGEWVPDD
jgi:hypothetical protein